jgi:hypothetical protein
MSHSHVGATRIGLFTAGCWASAIAGAWCLSAPTGPPKGVVQAAPAPIQRAPDAVVHGLTEGERLTVVDAGDVNGDQATDLVTLRSVRRGAPNEEAWFEILLGGTDWPNQASRVAYPRRIPIVMPQTRGILFPNEPNFFLNIPPLGDYNGDGIADLGATKYSRRGRFIDVEFAVYYGRDGSWPEIDIARTKPDLKIDQTGNGIVPKPILAGTGDFNGDGNLDLFVEHCPLPEPRNAYGQWSIYFGTGSGLPSVDLDMSTADVWLEHSGQSSLCVGDINGDDYYDGFGGVTLADANFDGRTDIWYSLYPRDVYHTDPMQVRLVLAPLEWQNGRVDDIVAAVIADSDKRNHVFSPYSVPDIDADGRPELAMYFSQKTRRITRGSQRGNLIWTSGALPGAAEGLDGAALRIAEGYLPRNGVLDLDQDGQADWVVQNWRADARESFAWRAFRGPLILRGEIWPRRDDELGDYIFELPAQPLTDTLAVWWSGDYNGDGADDFAISSPGEASPGRIREAGVISIYLSPSPTATPVEPVIIPLAPPASPNPRSTCQDMFEVDDLARMARRITLGQAQTRSFDSAGDVDYTVFTAHVGATIEAWTSNLGPLTDTRIELLADDGVTVLARNDDARGNAPASRVLWVAQTAGDYFARVTDVGSLRSDCGKSYDLTVIVQDLLRTESH